MPQNDSPWVVAATVIMGILALIQILDRLYKK